MGGRVTGTWPALRQLFDRALNYDLLYDLFLVEVQARTPLAAVMSGYMSARSVNVMGHDMGMEPLEGLGYQ